MELNQGEIIQKPKMQELSSLFMTHRLIVMYAPVKFHEYIPYSLGVMARTHLHILFFYSEGAGEVVVVMVWCVCVGGGGGGKESEEGYYY